MRTQVKGKEYAKGGNCADGTADGDPQLACAAAEDGRATETIV